MAKAKKQKKTKEVVPTVEMRMEHLPVGELKNHPENPNVGDVDKIMESIRVNGFLSPVVVQESSMQILAGAHRVKAARKLGLLMVPALVAALDDETALRFVLADNRARDDAVYDMEKLANVLSQFDTPESLAGTAYSAVEADVIKTRAAWQKESDLDPVTATKEAGMKVSERDKNRKEELEKLGRRSVILSIPNTAHAGIVGAMKSAREEFEVHTNEELLACLLIETGHLDDTFQVFGDEDGDM